MALYVNGKKVSGGGGGDASKRELTWAEYQALTEAEKNNGTMYFCNDVNGDGSDFQPIIYSEEEREIGVWTDGKPLYEKTVEFGALPNKTTKAVAHNISNIDHIWIYEGWAENNINGFTNMLSLATNSLSSQWYFGVTPTEIQCWTGSDRSNYDTCYVILHYTKSTDTAGSGTWTPQGVPAHHYSTDEQVVGTWVDGSTLYEKTVVYSGNIGHGSYTTIDNSLSYSGVGFFTVVNASAKLANFSNWFTYSAGGQPYDVALSDTLGLYVENFSNSYNISDVVVTVRYTKTTT